jgi:hypothetical protein
MSLKNILSCVLSLFIFPIMTYASGKIDAGPVYINMKVLQHGKTQQTLEMYGFRADATIQVFPGEGLFRGIVVKPSGTWAEGSGNFVTGGIGIGHYTPIMDCLAVTPLVGIVYSRLSTWVDYSEFGLSIQKQIACATTPYVGIDICYTINPQWLVSGSIQYGWAAGRTYIGILGLSKGQSAGPTLSAMVDYYVTPQWSINAAWAYNHTLTQERHGMKASGCRLGLGYTY